MATDNISIINNTLFIYPHIKLWGGRSKLNAEDLGLDKHVLPPSELASLGSIKLCDPVLLKSLQSEKRALERELLKFCFRFMGGFATNVCNTNKALQVLKKHESKFNTIKTDFVNAFKSSIKQWEDKHKTWKPVIQSRLPSLDSISSRITYSYHMTRIRTATDNVTDEASKCLVDNMNSLSNQLYSEIAVEARKVTESLITKSELTQKIKRPFNAIREKFDQLAYLDNGIPHLVKRIDHALSSLPKTGKFDGHHISNLILLSEFLSDVEKMKRHGSAVIESEMVADKSIEKSQYDFHVEPLPAESDSNPGYKPGDQSLEHQASEDDIFDLESQVISF